MAHHPTPPPRGAAGIAATKLSQGAFTDDNQSVWFLTHNVDNLAFMLETAFLVAYDSYDDIAMPKLRQLDWVRGAGWEGVPHATMVLPGPVCCDRDTFDRCCCNPNTLCRACPTLFAPQLTQLNAMIIGGVIVIIIVPISVKVCPP